MNRERGEEQQKQAHATNKIFAVSVGLGLLAAVAIYVGDYGTFLFRRWALMTSAVIFGLALGVAINERNFGGIVRGVLLFGVCAIALYSRQIGLQVGSENLNGIIVTMERIVKTVAPIAVSLYAVIWPYVSRPGEPLGER